LLSENGGAKREEFLAHFLLELAVRNDSVPIEVEHTKHLFELTLSHHKAPMVEIELEFSLCNAINYFISLQWLLLLLYVTVSVDVFESF
jgi:hypothetical protein